MIGRSEKSPLSFALAGQLDPARRLAAAQLVYESFAEFYDLLPVAPPDLLRLIDAQFALPNGEITDTVCGIDSGGHVIGVYAAVSASHLAAAQLVGVSGFLQQVPEETRKSFRAALKVFSGQVPPLPIDSYYLARFAVAGALRGTGVAGQLLEHFRMAGGNTSRLSTHVRRDNSRAIRFYEKFSFKIIPGDRNTVYLAMATI